jgi:hypothetical protein
MDKRKLFKDIARIKKQLFALSAFTGFFLVTVTTLITQGSDLFAVFRNAAISIIIFGILGYLWGWIYEKTTEESLVESYRMEAMERVEQLKSMGGRRVALTVSVSDLSPGMRVVDAVYNAEGALLARQGAVINDRMIAVLKDNNIQQIKVEAQQSAQDE